MGRLRSLISCGCVLLLGAARVEGQTGAVTYTYDALGRLISVVAPNGESATYRYDAVGNLLSITRQGSSQVSIASFSPTSGPVGTTVTILGSGFRAVPSENTVQFNGVTATVTSSTTTQIITVVPPAATTGPITVTTPTSSATSSSSFVVTVAPGAPTVSSFTPAVGAPSTPVTISGTNFEAEPSRNTVKFNGTAATVISASPTTIQTAVPAVAGSGRITVQTAAGQATSGTDFIVVPSPYSASSLGASGRLTAGTATTITLSAAGQIGIMVFDATQGQRIRLLTNSWISSTFITIYNPDGTVLVPATSVGRNGSYVDTPALPTTGTYSVLVVPQSGATGNITLLPLLLPASGDFSVSALPNPPQANTANPTYSVYVNPGSGFGGTVGLSVSGLPANTTATFNPTAVSSSGVSLLTVSPTASTPAGSYTLTITGVSGSLTRTTTAILDVNPVASPWANQDIGSVGIVGRAQYSGGTFTVQGSGAWIWNNSDSFHYVYRSLSGDAAIVARVASTWNTNTYSKAGLMIRETLTAGSANAMVEVQPNQKAAVFQYRITTGGSTTAATGPTAAAPYWLKLVRQGNTFTGYASAGGATWTQIGSSVNITMASSVYVGLVVSAEDNWSITTATFDNVTVTTTADFDLTATPFTAIRVNCGGGSYTDGNNQAWSADYGYSGGSAFSTGSSISGTATPVLYQSSRWHSSAFQYQFGVPNGTYAVKLNSAENSFSGAGQRVFNVSINEQTVLSNFDVVVEAGAAFKAVDRQFTVSVTTGQVVVQLIPVVSNPNINAIEILPAAGTGIYTVNVNPLGGFNGAVSLSASSLPSGGTGTFAPITVTPPGSSTLNVSTIPGTPQGNYTFGITGASGSLSHTVAAPLKVDGADFWITASPSSRTITAGSSTTYTVNIGAIRDFTGTVSLSAGGVPPGATGAFSPATVAGSGVSTLTITTSNSTPGRTYTLTITGNSGGLTRSVPVTLVILAPNFTLFANPSSQAVPSRGGSASYTVTASAVNGFSKTINFSVSGLPAGASATFNPGSVTGSGSSVLTVTTGAGTPPATSVLTVVGTSADTLGGNLTRSTKVSLIQSGLPSPWLNQDIGSVAVLGSARYDPVGTFTVQGSGSWIWNNSDSFQYVYRSLSGDGTIVARVATMHNTYTYSKAGVMIRETLAAGSPNAFVQIAPNAGSGGFQYRSASGGATSGSNVPAAVRYWVKLVRTGNTFTGYVSADGVSWTQIGSPVTISMTSTVYVGLAVSAENNYGDLTTATFDQVTLASGLADFYIAPVPVSRTVAPAGSATYSVNVNALNGFSGTVNLSASGLPAGATASFSPAAVTPPASSTLTVTAGASTPAGSSTLTITGASGVLTRSATAAFTVWPGSWANQDIGSVGVPGSARYDPQGAFTLEGSGSAISGNADAFHYAYQTLSGDGTVIARVVRTYNTSTNSKAGVMVRETLAAGSKNAMVGLQPGQTRAVFQWRSSTDGSSSLTAGPSAAPPYWVRLTREGNSFIGYASSDGVTWTQIGSSVTIAMASTVYVGLAVSAENNTALTTATFDNVNVAGGAADFYLSASPDASAARAAGSASYTVNVSALNGFRRSVSFGVAGLPAGATASFSPASVSGSGSTTLTVSTAAGTPGGNYALTITGTSRTLSHSATVVLWVSSLPSPWLDQDVGAVGIAGSASHAGGTFTLQASGAGANIRSSTDGFHFIYQTLTGDGTVIARVTGMHNAFTYSKAGVMIRETLSPGSPNASAFLRGPSRWLEFSFRYVERGNSLDVLAENLAGHQWVKLVRQGNTFRAYASSDGAIWVEVGSAAQPGGPVTIPMANTVYVGLAVSAGNDFALTTATLDSVTVTSP